MDNTDTFNIVMNIIMGIFPFALVIGIGVFALKTQKRLFLPLFNKFETEELMPAGSIRINTFRYGNGARVNNAVKMVETQDHLFLKFTLNKPLKIPYSCITSLATEDGMFKSKVLKITFTENNLKPLVLTLRASHLSKFPHLLKKATEHVEIKTGGESSDTVSPALGMATMKNEIIKTNPALPSQIGNIIRGIALIILVLTAAGFLITYYA